MSPEMLIGFGLCFLVLVIFSEKPHQREKTNNKRYKKTVTTLFKPDRETESSVDEGLNTVKKSRKTKSKVNHLAITEALLQAEQKRFFKIFSIYCFAFIIKIIISLFINFSMGGMHVFFILSIPITLIFIRNKIFEYRITKGLYGTTSYEARNLIRFIEKNVDMFDDSDGGSGRRVFSKKSSNEKEQPIWAQEKGLGELS